ncbi:MAG: transketolase C-terminal domain-containing protein, partial [Owenweeksia sp.]
VYLKPIDKAGLEVIFNKYHEVIIVEENSKAGGAGDTINSLKNEWNWKGKLKCRGLPDQFIEHGSRQELLEVSGLDHASIRSFIES